MTYIICHHVILNKDVQSLSSKQLFLFLFFNRRVLRLHSTEISSPHMPTKLILTDRCPKTLQEPQLIHSQGLQDRPRRLDYFYTYSHMWMLAQMKCSYLQVLRAGSVRHVVTWTSDFWWAEQPFTLTFSPTSDLDKWVGVTCMSLDFGMKSQHCEETLAGTGRTCKLRSASRFKPRNILLYVWYRN